MPARSTDTMTVQAEMWTVPPLHGPHTDINKSVTSSKGTGVSDGIKAGGGEEPHHGSMSDEPNSATPDVVGSMANVHSTVSRCKYDEVRYG